MKLFFSLGFLLFACTTAPVVPTPAETVNVTVAHTEVASVVVLEKKVCCACTDKRQKGSRAVYEAVVAKRPAPLPITVVNLDEEPEKAKAWQELQTPITTPAYYFLDAAGLLVGFLQGEISEEQVSGFVGTP